MSGAVRTVLCWIALGAALNACSPPGKPAESERYVRPDQVMDFDGLYRRHCSGCHGDDGRLGPARPLADPLYLAWADRDAVRRTIALGVPGTSMPAWLDERGGPLSRSQLDALVRQMFARWGDPDPLRDAQLPPYSEAEARAAGSAPGDAARGRMAYRTFCARCHGADGRGGAEAGSVVDSAFLGLVSDQALRSAVVAGRPDLGAPDFRDQLAGRPMSDREISDVVAWLAAQRPEFPGQPYAAAMLPDGESQ